MLKSINDYRLSKKIAFNNYNCFAAVFNSKKVNTGHVRYLPLKLGEGGGWGKQFTLT
jgi:hypothetical protein